MFSYTVTLSLLCVYLYVHSLVKTTANLSLTNLFYLIFKFHDTRSIFFILLGQLSGVGPGIFFFLKLNLLIVGTNTAHIFTIIFIFFNLLTATFIYLQFLPTASHKLVNRSQLKQIAKPLIKKKNLTSFISAYSMVAFISLSVFGTLTITLGFIIIENVLL